MVFICAEVNSGNLAVVQDKANPLAQVLSVAMMLRYGLGEEQAAAAIESAVNVVLDKGYWTGDISSPGKVLPVISLTWHLRVCILQALLKASYSKSFKYQDSGARPGGTVLVPVYQSYLTVFVSAKEWNLPRPAYNNDGLAWEDLCKCELRVG